LIHNHSFIRKTSDNSLFCFYLKITLVTLILMAGWGSINMLAAQSDVYAEIHGGPWVNPSGGSCPAGTVWVDKDADTVKDNYECSKGGVWVDDDSDLGIGTTDPKGKLDVYGDIHGVNEYSFSGHSDAVNFWDFNHANTEPKAGSAADDSWYVEGAGWGSGGLSKRRFRRTPGLTLEYEANMGSGSADYMICLVDGSSVSFTFNQVDSHCFYSTAGSLLTYEDGVSTGTLYSFDTRSAWWKFKLILKGTGAEYYVYRNDQWNLVQESTNNSNKYVRVLISAHSNRMNIRNMRVYQEKDFHRVSALETSGYVKTDKGLCIGGDCRDSWASSGDIGGTGTQNYVAKFTAPKIIAISQIFDDGSSVGIGTNAPAEDLHVFRADTDVARVYATGTAQGSGMFYAGQSLTYGGGFLYDGDGTPDIVGGDDRITFFRRLGNIDTEVFSYAYSDNNVYFSGNIGINTVSPASPLSVGVSSQFQVNSSGDVI